MSSTLFNSAIDSASDSSLSSLEEPLEEPLEEEEEEEEELNEVDEALDDLDEKDFFFVFSFLRQVLYIGNVNFFAQVELFYPPREDGDRQVLQVFDLRVNAFGTPFEGVAHDNLLVVNFEDIAPINIDELRELGEGFLYAFR